MPSDGSLQTLVAQPGSQLALAPGRTTPVVVVLGDSYAAGVGASDPTTSGYVPMLATDLGWDVRAVPAPGGGYVAGGYNGPMINLLKRIDLAQVDPDLIVLQAGHNDTAAPADEVRTRAAAGRRRPSGPPPRARRSSSSACCGRASPRRSRATTDTALRAAAEQGKALFAYTLDLRFPAIGGLKPTDDGYRDIAVRLRSSFTDLGLVAR